MAIRIEELLRKDWQSELLRYPCNCTGPLSIESEGARLAAQAWTDPDGTPHACFITDLPALSTRTFAVRTGAADADTGGTTVPRGAACDLAIEQLPDRVRIRTAQFGIELPLGHFKTGAPPPPVLSMQWSDGSSFGGGRWFGETPVDLEARLTAEGPVLAEMTLSWTWADGATGRLRVELAAGDCRAYWESWSSADRPDRGWDLSIAGLGPLTLLGIEGKKDWKNTWGLERGAFGDVTLDDKWTGMLTRLTPWHDWWDDQAQTSWRFGTPDRGEVLRAASYEVGDWVDPEPPGTFASWDQRIHKMLALCRSEDGDIHFRVDQAQGWRKWLFGAAGQPVGRELNRVKDLVLDWPDTRERPFLFVSPERIAAQRRPVDDPVVRELLEHADEDMDTPYKYGTGPGNDFLQNRGDDMAIEAWLLTGSHEVAERMHLVDRLRRRLNWLGDIDLMRYTNKISLFFDLVADSELVDPAERRVFRAQMAYLGYKLADPGTWSMERGYRSGPPNMSVSFILNLGIIACAIPDHPKASDWAGYATARHRQWMSEHLGPKGEWPESMHYIHVSTAEFISYAIAARNAGLADLLAEGPIKRVMLYAAKLHAPPDPRGEPVEDPIGNNCRHAGVRGMSPLGRAGSTGCSFGHYGLLAAATAESDPAFSRIMQWLYRETGWNEIYGNSTMPSLRRIAWDRTLPAQCPTDWESELFSSAVVLRDRIGQPDEDHLVFDAGAAFTSAGEHGGLNLWFWQGVPLVSRFSGGYDERAEALISNLSRAIPRTPDDPSSWSDSGNTHATRFAHLPSCDYAVLEGTRGPSHGQLHAYPPEFAGLEPGDDAASGSGILRWQRRILYVRDSEHGAFLVLRDRAVNEPGMWKLWTLSAGMAPAGGETVDDGELPGNTFRAAGQFGVDLDIHVAAPSATGRRTRHYRREYIYKKKLLQGFVDDQRLLQVDVAAGQACFCAAVPRASSAAPAEIDNLAGGRIIRVRRNASECYVVLADDDATVCAADVTCRGPAGLIRRTGDTTQLTLPEAGELAFGDVAVHSAEATDVEITPERVTVWIPYRKPGTRIIDLRLPGEWELRVPSSSFFDPQLVRHDGFWRVQLIPEVQQTVVLHRR